MADRPILLPQGMFAGHARAGMDAPTPDAELTQVGPGTPCGEYLRRFWQPVALAAQLGAAPVRLRRLGEDLVLFRDQSGNLGLLHLRCCHRNASLEHGIIERQGLRCAFHGWLFDVDGTILDMPAEPADSPLRTKLSQGAYPVLAHKGVIFAYLGPIADMPDFPVFDTMDRPAERLAPMMVEAAVNWLQVFEAAVDPVHQAFQAARAVGVPFHAEAASMPVVQYHERAAGNGVFHSAAWRVGEQVMLRVQDHILPNFAQDGAAPAGQGASLHFRRTALTRWVVPVDDSASVVIGWRHGGAAVEGGAPWLGSAEGREQLGASDAGVLAFRRRLRRAVQGLAAGEAPLQPTALVTTPIPTYAGDTVLTVPMRGAEDRSFMAGLGHRVADIYRASDGETGETREAAIRRGLRVLEAGLS